MVESGKKLKVCFAASSGGHYEQLMMLKPMMQKFDSFIITEQTAYSTEVDGIKNYYVFQINRKEKLCLLKFIGNIILSIRICLKEKPDTVICTGVLAMIPICLLMKAFGKKMIFIESFAKVTSPTLSGKLLYRYADQFYIQWESMREFYPNAIYLGGIY